MNTLRVKLILVSSAVALVVGCSGKNDSVEAPANSPPGGAGGATQAAARAPGGGPPVTVSTVQAQRRDVAVSFEATGTVVPLNVVDVKAQVSSTLAAVHFKEGQFVKAGQLLFTLDARTDQANVARVQAQLAKDNVALADAKRQFDRTQQLFAQNFISQGAVDTARALVESATATAAANQAAVNAAKVALSYSRIVAPHSGRAGAVNVFAGSAVQANTTALVTITQLDPVGVQFSFPQRNLSDALRALKDGTVVTARLADGGGSFTGRLQFVDNMVDASSGAVKAKAVFDNTDSKLWPGAFVQVKQTVTTLKDALVIPVEALVHAARGTVVYVVKDGKAVLRPVEVVYAEGGQAAVTGVQPGDAVVYVGKQNLRPNAPVVERQADGKPAGGAGGKTAQPAKAQQP